MIAMYQFGTAKILAKKGAFRWFTYKKETNFKIYNSRKKTLKSASYSHYIIF